MEGEKARNDPIELTLTLYGSGRKEKAMIKSDGNYEICHQCERPLVGETGSSDTSITSKLRYLFDREGYATCAGECYDTTIRQGIFPSFFVVFAEELSRIVREQKEFKRNLSENDEISDRITGSEERPSQA